MDIGARWTEPRLLSELDELDRSLLHFFVAGPGQGEAVAVALPQSGWLLVDGCRVKGGDYPLWNLFERFRLETEPPPGLILTHPHRDHALGIPELIERAHPQWVAFTGMTPDPLSQELEEVRERPLRLPLEHQQARAVQAALTAILEWGEADPSRLIPTCAGTSLPGSALTTVTAVAPARAFLEAFFAEPENLRNLGIRANRISLVLEIVYGETRLVLAGDLPDVDNKQASLSEGMSVVVGRAPRLANHRGMKLPHHGSWMATCDALMGDFPTSRYWCLTPFNSHNLPDLHHPRGLSHLLGKEAQIHLTALAAPQDRQFSRPSPPLTLEQLQEATRSAKESTDPFLTGAQELTMTECTGLEPIWCCAFDDRGQLRGRWRGNAAVVVTGPT